MRTKLSLSFLLLLLATSVAASAAAATSDTICVGPRSGCHATVQAAVDAARDGDTIRIGPGTFAGGITITKSVRVVGAGPKLTIIRGGGPVVTIGEPLAPNEHTVTIAGVTITGGRTSGDGVEARGGGIHVPPATDFTTGATVSLRDVLVVGNQAKPTRTVTSPSGAPCPDGPCPFARAAGAGIANSGTMSLTRTVVSRNRADAGVGSDAAGGGIHSELGSLTLDRSVVAGNRAVATPPNARFAEGGGVFVDTGSGPLTIKGTVISGNRSDMTSTLPIFAADGETVIDMNASAGGVHVGDGVSTLVDRAVIAGNAIRATDPVGEPLALDVAMYVGDSPVVMRDTLITGNRGTATVATTEDVGASGTVIEFGGSGRISNTRITDNHITVTSPDGVAGATGGVAVYNFSDQPPERVVIADSVVSDNTTRASSTTGSATVQGVGVLNNSLLELRDVVVRGNSGRARGPEATAQGGGIWNGVLFSGPPVELTLRRTRVVENSLTTSAGGTVQGAGLYTTEPVTLQDSVIARNRPDQCSGCPDGAP
jgi:hypothetical protein